jgi:hypothetical protein
MGICINLADDTSGSVSVADYGHMYLADDGRCQWRIMDMGTCI